MYCYQNICGGTPVWPEKLSEIYNDKMQAIDQVCQDISVTKMPKPVTPESLSESPGAYVPMLTSIMKKYELLHQQQSSQDENLPRLFSLTPVPSLRWRFISINPNALAAFARISLPSTYEGKLDMFNRVFDFKKLKIDRLSHYIIGLYYVFLTNSFYCTLGLKLYGVQTRKKWLFRTSSEPMVLLLMLSLQKAQTRIMMSSSIMLSKTLIFLCWVVL
jgi:hypothetical protein